MGCGLLFLGRGTVLSVGGRGSLATVCELAFCGRCERCCTHYRGLDEFFMFLFYPGSRLGYLQTNLFVKYFKNICIQVHEMIFFFFG